MNVHVFAHSSATRGQKFALQSRCTFRYVENGVKKCNAAKSIEKRQNPWKPAWIKGCNVQRDCNVHRVAVSGKACEMQRQHPGVTGNPGWRCIPALRFLGSAAPSKYFSDGSWRKGIEHRKCSWTGTFLGSQASHLCYVFVGHPGSGSPASAVVLLLSDVMLAAVASGEVLACKVVNLCRVHVSVFPTRGLELFDVVTSRVFALFAPNAQYGRRSVQSCVGFGAEVVKKYPVYVDFHRSSLVVATRAKYIVYLCVAEVVQLNALECAK